MTTINRIILQASRRYKKVDPALISAIVRAESRFDNRTLSHAGAMGLMQLMPETARNLGLPIPGTRPRTSWRARASCAGCSMSLGAPGLLSLPTTRAPGAVKRHGGLPTPRLRSTKKVLACRAKGG